jgi:three-Cys-motif partner protein
MVSKPYTWKDGAILEEHSRRKHQIIRQYFGRYIRVRCQLPQQSKFRFAIVDGFAGGGIYKCGASGSPLIFIEELRAASIELNLRRASEGMSPLDIECVLIFNDYDSSAIESLKQCVEPLIADIKDNTPRLHLNVQYRQQKFERVYPEIREFLQYNRVQSVLFNLDQCGNSHVERETLADIIASFSSPEIFYTFAIEALIAFLQKTDPNALNTRLNPIGVDADNVSKLALMMNDQMWLGTAERLVFEAFERCASYVSPFSIHNPSGWNYWMLHFAKSHRARQEYNDVLHDNASTLAHYGRSGLHMLAYDPRQEGGLYLFDMTGRDSAKSQLHGDIPRLVSEFGDAVSVADFYASIYTATPAHTHDIHSVMIENPDLQVVTARGGDREAPHTIRPTDTLRLKQQRSFSFSQPPNRR